jgi:hypothetical protein
MQVTIENSGPKKINPHESIYQCFFSFTGLSDMMYVVTMFF